MAPSQQISAEENMKTRTIALLVSLVFVSVALGFQNNPQFGTWKLNDSKSKIEGKARNQTVVIEAVGDQIKVTVDGVDATGAAAHNEWTGKFDGKDYPVTGDAAADTRYYRPVGAKTWDVGQKKDGKTTSSGRVVISGDGKTRTVTINGTDSQGKKFTNVSVYDKQ
jgi:hypothetical protein